MTQLSLALEAEASRPRTPATARSRDPVTSHLAAQGMNDSGALRGHRALILAVLMEHAPSALTGPEIADRTNDALTRYQVQRRLRDLARDGLIEQGESRKCRITGSECLTWRARTDG